MFNGISYVLEKLCKIYRKPDFYELYLSCHVTLFKSHGAENSKMSPSMIKLKY